MNFNEARLLSFFVFFLSFFLSFFLLSSSGASACVKLNQFEEAIKWCDKGLAVSLIAISKRCFKYLRIFAIHEKQKPLF